MPKPRPTFDNPVIPGFYPDPSVCRVGEDYYLVTSSFEYFPGIPIFHSRDLVHWKQLGHVLDKKSKLPLEGVKSSGGLYAPTIRYHAGRFYVVCTNVRGDTGPGGNFVVTATRPEGPWSQPKFIDQEGIDPSLFFDADGTVYYTRDGHGPDFSHPLIYGARIDLSKGKTLGKPKPIFAGTGGVWPEASHLYRVGAYYYLMIAEGGTSYEHSIVVARSKKPLGPFETCPHNPVLSHVGRPRHPIQATGHADLIETQNGEFYAVLLGIRPKGGRFHHLGRETFLVPVTWGEDGWPRFGETSLASQRSSEPRGPGEVRATLPFPNLPPEPPPRPKPRVEFKGDRLPHEFTFVRNPDPKSFSLTARKGFLRLSGLPGTASDVAPLCFIGRRQQYFDCTFTTQLDFEPQGMADVAGLVVRSSEAYHYEFLVRRCSLENEHEREAQLWSVVAGKKKLVDVLPLAKGKVVLQVIANAKDYQFAIGQGKRRRAIGSLPTHPLSCEYQMKRGDMPFTGVVIGMYASGQGEKSQSPADFEWFEVLPQNG